MLKKGKFFYNWISFIKFSQKHGLLKQGDLPSDLRPHIRTNLEIPEDMTEEIKKMKI